MKQDRLICLIAIALLWWLPEQTIIARSPCPGKGLHVLIVEDRLARRDLPAGQLSGLMSVEIDKLIQSKGGHPKYMYDQKQDVAAKEDWVQKAMQLPRESLPWIVLDHDGNGTSQAAPKSLSEFKTLVESY